MRIIIYISRAKQNFTSGDLAELHELADARSRSQNITGLLLFDGIRFIQALEGDDTAVQAVMSQIIEDPRHDNISYFNSITTDSRQFKSWTMKHQDVRDLREGKRFLDLVMAHVSDVKCDSIKAAFIGFASLSLSRRLTV